MAVGFFVGLGDHTARSLRVRGEVDIALNLEKSAVVAGAADLSVWSRLPK